MTRKTYSGGGDGVVHSQQSFTTFSPRSDASGDQSINNLLNGTKWGAGKMGSTVALSYSFAVAQSVYVNDGPYSPYHASFESAQIVSAQAAMEVYEAVSGLTFTEMSDSAYNAGDIRWGNTTNVDLQSACASRPSSDGRGGDIWIGPNNPTYQTPTIGASSYLVFMHELGHALGLGHPHQGLVSATAVEDQLKYTVMSYRSYPGQSVTAGHQGQTYFPTTLMLNDILAIQYLYGVNTSYKTGDDTYEWTADKSVFETIWDAGGIDTISAASQAQACVLNLNSGQWSQIGVAFSNGRDIVRDCLTIAYGTTIENAVGSAYDDKLIGNKASNTLEGGAGADVIAGGAGNDMIDGGVDNDLMLGGAGNDTYVVDSVDDRVFETTTTKSKINAGGLDTVFTSVDWTLGAYVENLVLTGSSINGTGNALANKITSSNGGNTLRGGAGNDTYIVASTQDTIVETMKGGIDTVVSSVDWQLGAYVENLVLEGIAFNGTGNALNNRIVGNAFGNVLDGVSGNDTLIGGDGSDLYLVDSVRDIVKETNADVMTGGSDGVEASVSWTLGANVENLTLIGTANLNGTGNALDNMLFGNDGNNVLYGGGMGVDGFLGGKGDDTYIIDADDTVMENPDEGKDTIKAGITFNLETASNVENLFLTGKAAIDGTGNALDNILVGNVGANKLTGGLGDDTYVWGQRDQYIENSDEGNDTIMANIGVNLTSALYANIENVVLTGVTAISAVGNEGNNVLDGSRNRAGNKLIGGDGDDTYIVGKGDKLIEGDGINSGIDTVKAAITYTLGANLEDLTLLGQAKLNGTGNALANDITGNDGNNVMNGGLGNDTLFGGLGKDSFVFTAALGDDNIDSITDFTAIDDAMGLSRSIFKFVGAKGVLSAGAFHSSDSAGWEATTANHHILYDESTGNLYYDADGIGEIAAVNFATLVGAPTIDASDFVLF